MDRDGVDPEEKILAEAALGDLGLQWAQRSRDNPHVDVDRAIGAQALDLALLEHAQQLDLEVQRQLADLVEKESPSAGRLELVLVDLVMPRMDGMTMLDKLRAQPDGKNIPIIILTNLADADKARVAADQGVFDFLIKADWKLADLVNRVREQLKE